MEAMSGASNGPPPVIIGAGAGVESEMDALSMHSDGSSSSGYDGPHKAGDSDGELDIASSVRSSRSNLYVDGDAQGRRWAVGRQP